MIKSYISDLHIHTCLSPCADLTMSPKRIAAMAVRKKLDMIGICDHNSAENVLATVKAAPEGLTVKAGMEITSVEEVHILALFDEFSGVKMLQDVVYENLPDEYPDSAVFGDQIVANERDEVEYFNKKMLFAAVSLSMKEIVALIHEFKGIAIASHVDRQAFSVFSQLGFIPKDIALDALEISANMSVANLHGMFPQTVDYALIQSSDAHMLKDIGKTTTTFLIEAPTVAEIQKACKGEDGRSIFMGAN